MHVTLWSGVLNETFVGPQLDKKIPTYFRELNIYYHVHCPYPGPVESSACPPKLFKIQFNTSPLHLGVPSGLSFRFYTIISITLKKP
jgi:hypothetical protein